MAWIYLFIAGAFEIGWVIGLKYAEGFTTEKLIALKNFDGIICD